MRTMSSGIQARKILLITKVNTMWGHILFLVFTQKEFTIGTTSGDTT
jgi:hypothetical protein